MADSPANPPAPPTLPAGRAPAGLYLHLPFCFHKCHYCDFYSVVAAEGPASPLQDQFTDALLAELDLAARRHTLRPRTIFCGGGTPSYLRPDLWARLLAALRGHGVLERAEEFTIEANPETLTPGLLAQLTAGGVNRISIGAQSFDPEALKTLERWHEPANVARSVALCRAAGLSNFNLDLIFAIPGQTLATLGADLDRLLELDPPHLSIYGLTYEPRTALTARLKAGRVSAIPEELERDMYALVLDRLEAAGYEHYEVSNWAKPGHACRHNLLYWHNAEWLGLGPAAASHLDGCRWKNAPNLTEYVRRAPAPPVEDFERLPPERRAGEQLMLGLRLREGVETGWLDGWLAQPGKASQRRRENLAQMLEMGFLERTPERVRLTRKGLFVADSVIAKLM